MISQVEAVKLLDEGNLDELIKAYEVVIYHYLHRYNLYHRFSAHKDDFLQEGRLAIWKALTLYNHKSKLATYVHSSVRNAIFNYVKKNKLYAVSNDVEYNDLDQNGEETADMKTLTLYDDVLGEMRKSKYRDILELYFLFNLSQDEVGKVKGISQQRVATIVNNFKKEVKEIYGSK
jgi:RNA polymerase sigma factor (sigma-70 family)